MSFRMARSPVTLIELCVPSVLEVRQGLRIGCRSTDPDVKELVVSTSLGVVLCSIELAEHSGKAPVSLLSYIVAQSLFISQSFELVCPIIYGDSVINQVSVWFESFRKVSAGRSNG